MRRKCFVVTLRLKIPDGRTRGSAPTLPELNTALDLSLSLYARVDWRYAKISITRRERKPLCGHSSHIKTGRAFGRSLFLLSFLNDLA